MSVATAANAFIGKAKKPTERELTSALGESKALWDQLAADLQSSFGLKPEWNSYSKKAGWSMKMKHHDRNIVYLGPVEGSFRIALILGDKAVKAALASDLPTKALKAIRTATKYQEGTAVRMEVKNADDVDVVRKLTAIKLEH